MTKIHEILLTLKKNLYTYNPLKNYTMNSLNKIILFLVNKIYRNITLLENKLF